jgi:hypothetical protein
MDIVVNIVTTSRNETRKIARDFEHATALLELYANDRYTRRITIKHGTRVIVEYDNVNQYSN